ncbi:hypothetical protein N2152v2_004061 [Parachlorella kessleri]
MYYAFSGGGATCRDFWQASGPKQTQPPVTAWRQAFRKTVESGIQLSEVSAEVASISVACNDPAPEFFTNLRRVLLGTYTKDSLFNTFVGTFVGIAGAGSPFQPIHMEYKAQDIFYICPVGFGGCAPYRYDPTLANYQSS